MPANITSEGSRTFAALRLCSLCVKSLRHDSSAQPQLLRALVDPRSDQSDLFRGQRRDLILIIRRRHEIIFIADMGDIVNENAAGTISGQHDFVLPALERGLEAVQTEFALLLFCSVTLRARLLEYRFNIFCVRDPRGRRWGRKLAGIDL